MEMLEKKLLLVPRAPINRDGPALLLCACVSPAGVSHPEPRAVAREIISANFGSSSSFKRKLLPRQKRRCVFQNAVANKSWVCLFAWCSLFFCLRKELSIATRFTAARKTFCRSFVWEAVTFSPLWQHRKRFLTSFCEHKFAYKRSCACKERQKVKFALI